LAQEMRRNGDDLEIMSSADNHNAQQAADQMRRFADRLTALQGSPQPGVYVRRPTHWMPLPAPPSPEQP
jgi:hypothetical protein